MNVHKCTVVLNLHLDLLLCDISFMCVGLPGGDLLVSLTSAFDKKLKSLSVPSDAVIAVNVEEKQQTTKSDDEQADVQTYRDPSLHRSLERRSQHITEKHVSVHVNNCCWCRCVKHYV